MIIDGVTYNVGIVKVTRIPTIDQIELGKTLDGQKHYLTRGTYYDYEVTISTKNMDVNTYDSLYELITNPVESHVVELPYGQSIISLRASLSVGNDDLMRNYINLKRWGTLKIKIESLEYTKEVD